MKNNISVSFFILATMSSTACGLVPPSHLSHADNSWMNGAYVGQKIEIDVVDVHAVVSERREASFEQGGFILLLDTPKADLNSDPIEYWYTVSEGHVASFHLVGHADGPCCALASSALRTVALSEGLSHQSHGTGMDEYECDTARGCTNTQVLDDLLATMQKLEGEPDSKCAGQLFGNQTTLHALTEVERQAEQTAVRACELADESDTVVAIWSNGSAIPAFVPLRDRHGEEVLISLPVEEFDIPEGLTEQLAIDDVDRAIQIVSASLVYLDELIRLGEDIGPTAEVAVELIRLAGDEMGANVVNAEPLIEEQIYSAEQLWAWVNNIEDLFALDTATAPLTYFTEPEKREIADNHRKAREFLDRSVSFNESAIGHLGGRRDGATNFSAVTYETIANPWYAEVQAARKLRKQLRSDLEWLREEAPRVVASSSRAELLVLDAALRGWPASWVEPESERSFDEWQSRIGAEAWTKIDGQLEDRYGFRDGRNRLLLSNLWFEVSIEDGQVRLVPHYVLGSDYLTICEPNTGFARFESVHADQNLMTDDKMIF